MIELRRNGMASVKEIKVYGLYEKIYTRQDFKFVFTMQVISSFVEEWILLVDWK